MSWSRKNIICKPLYLMGVSFCSEAQCWNGFTSPSPVLITWYVPHAMAEENDWIAIRIRIPEKKPIIPSSLKMAAVVSMMFRYFISVCDVTNNIWAGWAISEGLFVGFMNFCVRLAIFSQTDLFSHGPLRQVCVLSLVLMTSKGVVGIEASPPAIPPHK